MERICEGNYISVLPSDVYKEWVRMILIRVRVPNRLSALGVFPLDIETYKSVSVIKIIFKLL